MACLNFKINVYQYPAECENSGKVSFLIIAGLFTILTSIYGKESNLYQWSSIFSVRQSYLEGLLKSLLGIPFRFSDTVYIWGKGLRICTSNKFSGDAEATGYRHHTLRITNIDKTFLRKLKTVLSFF